jgi:hypothetical protein
LCESCAKPAASSFSIAFSRRVGVLLRYVLVWLMFACPKPAFTAVAAEWMKKQAWAPQTRAEKL